MDALADQEIKAAKRGMPMFDVAIVGGGPAGATLTRLIGRQMKVLLIETKAGPGGGAKKCCGGLLGPDAQRELAVQGLGLPWNVLAGPQLFLVRAVDLQSGAERFYPRHYINIDRGRFDEWLLSLIPGVVDARYGSTAKTLEWTTDGIEIGITSGGRDYREKARMVIGADGAGSRVRRIVEGSPPAGRNYIAVQEWIPEMNGGPYFSAFFDPAVTDYYAWAIPKDGQLILGAALPYQSDCGRRFDALRCKLKEQGWNLPAAAQRKGALLSRPSRHSDVYLGRPGMALVGEAAGLISPSSGEGISYALRSARLLAGSLSEGTKGCLERYSMGTFSLRQSIWIKRMKAPLIYSPVLRNIGMATGLMSVNAPAGAGPSRENSQT